MKKFVSGMLAAAMALSLAACSSSGSSSAADDSSSAATTEESSTAESTGTPHPSGRHRPLTGDNAAYGIAVSNGAELAVNEINAAAGTEVFTLDFQDDESDSEKAVNAFNTLLDGGMQILVGPVTSNPSISVAAECVSENIFMLTPSASSVDVVTAGEGNAFQMCFTDPTRALPLPITLLTILWALPSASSTILPQSSAALHRLCRGSGGSRPEHCSDFLVHL